MLSGQILNSNATLNNFIVIDAKEFIPGEEFKLQIRIINNELNGLRYIPPNTCITKFTFNDTNGNTFQKTATKLTDDRSIMSMTIEESESEILQSGTITFEIDELGNGTKITKGIIQGALVRIIDGVC